MTACLSEHSCIVNRVRTDFVRNVPLSCLAEESHNSLCFQITVKHYIKFNKNVTLHCDCDLDLNHCSGVTSAGFMCSDH